jgi:drug/metabolite transporter (DMT)-like permease
MYNTDNDQISRISGWGLMSIVIGNLWAFLAFTIFSSGTVLMKAGSAWLKWHGPRNSQFRRALFLWLLGFFFYNVSIVPNLLAAKALPAYILAAVSGWQIVVIVLLSAWWLKEHVYTADIFYAALIVASIFILNISEKAGQTGNVNAAAFYVLLLSPFILLLPAIFKKTSIRLKATLFSFFSGCINGISLVILNIVTHQYGLDIFAYFLTPYPYLFLSCGLIGFIALQLALRWSDLMLVGPLQTSLTIVYPAFCSFFIFGLNPGIIQIVSIIVVVFSCIAILRKH